MKALTVAQPWATLIAIGAKRIETRSWMTRHRGPLAIHAARAFPRIARDLARTSPFAEALATGRARIAVCPDPAADDNEGCGRRHRRQPPPAHPHDLHPAGDPGSFTSTRGGEDQFHPGSPCPLPIRLYPPGHLNAGHGPQTWC
jgi:ASCH domain